MTYYEHNLRFAINSARAESKAERDELKAKLAEADVNIDKLEDKLVDVIDERDAMQKKLAEAEAKLFRACNIAMDMATIADDLKARHETDKELIEWQNKRLDTALELLRDIYLAHRDPRDHDYQECEKIPCCLCSTYEDLIR